MQKIGNPTPLFLDARGTLLDSGKIYIGVADGNPETSPIPVYWDSALTIEASQPLRTLGGMIVNGTNPAAVFSAEDDYSMRVDDAFDTLVFYSPSLFVDTNQFQPKDSDLTAIAALTTTPYGRALLTLADQAALATATGIAPFTGGSVTTAITRQGGGVYPYWNSASMTGGRIFLTAAGAGDPTSQPGDIWFTY